MSIYVIHKDNGTFGSSVRDETISVGCGFLNCTYTHIHLLSAYAPMSQHNVYKTYPEINTSAYSSTITDINKKRYPARLHTAFWGPPMCTEERKKDTEEEEEEDEQRSETKKAVVKTSTKDDTDTTPSILNNVQHREQDKDKYKISVCKLE